MKITDKFFETTFSSSSGSKDAYLKACRWLAENVISKAEAHDVQYTITKTEIERDGENLPAFKVELFCSLSEGEIRKKYCDMCYSFSHSMFAKREFDCSRCSMLGYNDKLKEKMVVKVGYRKERLRFLLKNKR